MPISRNGLLKYLRSASLSTSSTLLKNGEHLIELALRDRIELVIVAARAAERQPEERPRRWWRRDRHRLYAILLEVDAAFVVAGRVAMEAGGDQLIDSGIRQQVAGDLLDHELIERHVVVDRVDHPVAILPDIARRVDGVAVRVGIARQVEPVAAPAFAIMRRREQSVDNALVCIGRLSFRKSVNSSGVGGRPVRSR